MMIVPLALMIQSTKNEMRMAVDKDETVAVPGRVKRLFVPTKFQ